MKIEKDGYNPQNVDHLREYQLIVCCSKNLLILFPDPFPTPFLMGKKF